MILNLLLHTYITSQSDYTVIIEPFNINKVYQSKHFFYLAIWKILRGKKQWRLSSTGIYIKFKYSTKCLTFLIISSQKLIFIKNEICFWKYSKYFIGGLAQRVNLINLRWHLINHKCPHVIKTCFFNYNHK